MPTAGMRHGIEGIHPPPGPQVSGLRPQASGGKTPGPWGEKLSFWTFEKNDQKLSRKKTFKIKTQNLLDCQCRFDYQFIHKKMYVSRSPLPPPPQYHRASPRVLTEDVGPDEHHRLVGGPPPHPEEKWSPPPSVVYRCCLWRYSSRLPKWFLRVSPLFGWWATVSAKDIKSNFRQNFSG